MISTDVSGSSDGVGAREEKASEGQQEVNREFRMSKISKGRGRCGSANHLRKL